MASNTDKKAKKKSYERFKYTEEDMQRALESVRKGMSVNKASKAYSIPKSTLHSKITEKVPEERKMGPKSILTAAEELRLEQWILNKANLGFPLHPNEVKDAVQHILQEVPRKNPFIDNKPGTKWFRLFLKRHPSIVKANSELLPNSRTAVSEESLREWFKTTENYLKENRVLAVLERPRGIFNCGEIAIQLCPESDSLAEEETSEKKSITVFYTFSATGEAVPPMIIYPYKRIPGHVTESVPFGWLIGKSESGSMTSNTFFEYITNIFYPWCLTNKIELPVIFFLDGLKSQISLELSEFCVEKKIILYCLPLNSAQIMHPCDVAILNILEANWKSVVREYKQKTRKVVTKTAFASLFKDTFDRVFDVNAIKSGFESCGLYPFDENAVDYSKCVFKRRSDSLPSADKEAVSTNDLTTVKSLVEQLIGDINVQLYSDMRNNSEACSDSLYILWKLCIDHIENPSIPIDVGQFQNLISVNLSQRHS